MAVLFDLDQTLIDSSSAEKHRKARSWSHVYKLIPQMKPYIGINDLLALLNRNKVACCIITSAPSAYCDRVIRHWGWKISTTVCFHDTAHHKPHPDPIMLALTRLRVGPESALSIGDDAKDIMASKAARVKSVGAIWGCQNRIALVDSRPDFLCETVKDLHGLLLDWMNQMRQTA
jgi:HAD superfamily hydrolase (TIGR01549 family)